MSTEIEYLRERNAVLTSKYEETTKENIELHREMRKLLAKLDHPARGNNA